MKPEPLTKEIEKKWKKLIWDDEHPEFWDVFEDYLDIGILDEVKKVIRKRVQLLLKEIEKEMKIEWNIAKETSNISEKQSMGSYGYYKGLKRAKDLIKKAFSGVIENV